MHDEQTWAILLLKSDLAGLATLAKQNFKKIEIYLG